LNIDERAPPARVGRPPRTLTLLPAAFLLAPSLLTASLFLLAGCGSAGKARQTQALVAIGAGLKGPAGLKATVYAKGPATAAAFTFDGQGRLWLTAAGLSTHTYDGVYMIARQGARALKVVSGLDDPLGLAWYQNKLYVASVGRVDAFGGFNGRRFTQHTKILGGPLAGGENNLLVMAPNGRFVMGVTATCDHCTPTSKWSGSIVSFLPNGSDLRLYAGRIRAPFGFAFFPGTSDLFVSMNQRDDLGAATPGDWLSFVREGQQWGFPGCYGQGGAVCAGVPEPTVVLDKHGAVGGVAIVTGQLGASIATSAIVPEWNVAKVQRVALQSTGSSYQASVTPFLAGVVNPLAIALAPDRSLLVGDWATGTIYRISASFS
jgi:glucose/arabinose dehydrogenase